MTAKTYTLTRIFLCVGLAFATLFLAVGYAALSDTLTITGDVHWQEPIAVYITSVSVAEYNKTSTTPTVSKVGFHVVQYGNFSLDRQTGWGSNSAGGYVTVDIMVKNNSGKDQFFQKYIWEHSGRVSVEEGFQIGEKILHGESKRITIRIQNTSTSSNLSMNGKELTLVFSPQFDENDTVEATRNIAEIFKNVLDGKGPDGDGAGIVVGNRTYSANQIVNELLNRMTDNPSTGDYMGNVSDAPDNQKEIINAIFEDAFIQIGNQTYSVHLLIKQQEISGDNRPDMVLYVTADQLNVGGGNWQGGGWGQQGSWQNLNYVPVYGLVFINTGTVNNVTTYEQCDHMFMGEAPVCNFDGDFGANNVGNFNTNQWRSTEFDVTDGSADNFNQNNNTSDGELNEAYYYYVTHNS